MAGEGRCTMSELLLGCGMLIVIFLVVGAFQQ